MQNRVKGMRAANFRPPPSSGVLPTKLLLPGMVVSLSVLTLALQTSSFQQAAAAVAWDDVVRRISNPVGESPPSVESNGVPC